MIHTDELDSSISMLGQLRAMHPVRLGDIIEGKEVIETCYIMHGNYNVPVFKLKGEHDHRVWTPPQ